MEIIIKNLSKNFKNKKALDNINLEIKEGMFGLLGRNGAGKTTLMRILVTLLSKSSGDIKICNVPITESNEIRKIVGYLPQEFSFYRNLTVYEAIDYLGILACIPRKERKEKINNILEKVNLLEYKKVKVKALSGGMKRRLGIAQAIINDPKVLIVDEPTAGLDPEERIRFRNLLSEIAKEKIVILSTHIASDIEATCKNVAILDSGSIRFNGSVKELINEANGFVYSMKIKEDELSSVKEKYIVTGILSLGNEAIVRVISKDKPSEDAILSEPTVEDAYMLVMRGKENL